MQDVSKILTRKYYGKKDPFRSREFRQPRWMELLAVLLFFFSQTLRRQMRSEGQ